MLSLNPEKLPPLRDIIAKYELRAQKSLGQNFLLDQNITDKIARYAGDLYGRMVFEIGPGPGGLTRSILKAGARKVVAIEFDQRCVTALQELKIATGERLEIIHSDALKTNLLPLGDAPRVIVANLPYNIATPLLIRWLRQIRNEQSAFESMTLMFQKEVGRRIVAKSGIKAYGRLSVICQWLCDVSKVYDLPPSAFTPPPKVSSSVIKFVPKKLEAAAPEFEQMEKITAAAFGQRRKMIRSSLKDYADKFDASDIDPMKRAENLEVADFLNLLK